MNPPHGNPSRPRRETFDMTLDNDHWEELCDAVVARDWSKVDLVVQLIADRGYQQNLRPSEA